MKILHINASYKPAFIYGGPTVSVAKLCESFDSPDEKSGQATQEGFDSPDEKSGQATQPDNKEKIEISVYTTLANGKEELPYKNGEIKTVNGVKVHYFKRITKDHSHFSPSFLVHFWKNVKAFDIIHIHAWWNLVSVGAALICVLKGKEYILSPRGTLSSYSFYNRKSLLKRLFHLMIGKPILKKAIFQVSSGKEKQDIAAILGASCKVQVIPNFVELNAAWAQDFCVDVNHPKAALLFFSRIEEKKGLEFLLHACALLSMPFHLNIAGSGEERYLVELKNLSERLKIAQYITWLGQVASERKFEVLAKYDLLILPSYDENFANVVIESLACGTPVLLTPKVGLADYVVKKELGWVVEQDAKLIADELETIFRDKKTQLMEMSVKAKHIIKQDFAEDTLRNIYVEFYQSIVFK